MAADDHAVVVGITDYPKLKSLRGAVLDACAFRDWLVSPDGGAIPDANVRLITSPEKPDPDPLKARPVVADVQLALDGLQQLGFDNANKAGRRLWLYFSGHGVAPAVGDVALLMANATIQRLYYLPVRPYVEWFQAAAMFDEVVLVADCCREHLARLRPFALPWDDLGATGADVKFFGAYATMWSRKAREKPVDGTGEVRGVFTRAVLEGLVAVGTTKRLSGFVTRRVAELVEPTEFQQPMFVGEDELQLSAKLPLKPCSLHVHFDSPDAGVTVTLLDGQLEEIASFAMTGEPRTIELDAGLYALRRSDRAEAVSAFPIAEGDHEAHV